MQSDLMTRDEAAEYLRVKPCTLLKWGCQGRGPAFYKTGRLVAYRLGDIENWLADQKTNLSANG